MNDYILISKILGVIGLYLFLPITALTYNLFRLHRRRFEVDRILEILHIDPGYRKVYSDEKPGQHFLWAMLYVSVVTCIGLMLLFLGAEIFPSGEFPAIPLSNGNAEFPYNGSRLVFGMAFLGAYVWGLQYVFRRYALSDLTPDVYYSLSTRMIWAGLVAFVIYNAYEAVVGGETSEVGATSQMWPVVAFLLGMFPQRGLRWLVSRVPMVAAESNPTVRDIPLNMIEGVESHDTMRLEELGIDTCYDLANVDFVPLLISSPYSARTLIDWILQAKLCVYFGDAVKDLRQNSIRTVLDLKQLTPEDVEALVPETALTKSALERARKAIQENGEIDRLLQVGQLLGMFTKNEDVLEPSGTILDTISP